MRLKSFRIILDTMDVSARQVADVLGITPMMLSRIVNGTREFDKEHLVILKEYFGVYFEELKTELIRRDQEKIRAKFKGI